MLQARGLWLYIAPHAYDGMNQERPPLDPWDIIHALENATRDDGSTAECRIARRIVIVRYTIRGDTIHVRSISATRSSRA